jgi:hypothetical protein
VSLACHFCHTLYQAIGQVAEAHHSKMPAIQAWSCQGLQAMCMELLDSVARRGKGQGSSLQSFFGVSLPLIMVTHHLLTPVASLEVPPQGGKFGSSTLSD